MTNDALPPPNPESFDNYLRRSLASMAPDIEPAMLGEIIPESTGGGSSKPSRPSGPMRSGAS